MNARLVPVVALLAAATGGCAKRVDRAAEEQALLQRDRAWATAAAAGNVDTIVSYWTDDARVLLEGQPPYQGRQAIRAMVVSSLALPGFHITWTPQVAVVSASGDLGYTFGSNDVTAPDAAGHLTRTIGRYIAVWRKGADGVWRCSEDIENSGPQAAPRTPA